MINTIIFDLGAVLIDWNPHYMYRTIFADEEEMKHFLTNVTTSDWNEEQDAGRPLKEGTELLVAQFPEHEDNIRAFYSRWEEMLGIGTPAGFTGAARAAQATQTPSAGTTAR